MIERLEVPRDVIDRKVINTPQGRLVDAVGLVDGDELRTVSLWAGRESSRR